MFERSASESQESAGDEISEIGPPDEAGDTSEINIPESDGALDGDVEAPGG